MPLYTNLDGTTPDKGLGELLKWNWNRPRPERGFLPPRMENDGALIASSAPSLTWVGHATWLMRLGGELIATDPIWSTRVGHIKRTCPPGVALERIPVPDIVTISHSHYDHLDIPTLRRIGPDALYIVPKDVGEVLRRAGLPRIIELGWWETHREGDVAITLVPAQHWSARLPWDRNRRLWGGFVYESQDGTAYHAGDTAFKEEVFAQIAGRFPAIDYALLPIGAYDPTWFMQAQHMGPEEAGRAWEILNARTLVAMHWGTFRLTDEPMGEPPQRLRAFWQERQHDPERLWIFPIGETKRLAPAAV
ncbi:MBL fold metallo-hydrolase [Pendulispora albinea]|uniref:MBL fold metallo-hydrolase n=1 Tax=Pendulispora albinea TaxID=2741071 RepID=A0ABZ2M8Z4_9BACT